MVRKGQENVKLPDRDAQDDTWKCFPSVPFVSKGSRLERDAWEESAPDLSLSFPPPGLSTAERPAPPPLPPCHTQSGTYIFICRLVGADQVRVEAREANDGPDREEADHGLQHGGAKSRSMRSGAELLWPPRGRKEWTREPGTPQTLGLPPCLAVSEGVCSLPRPSSL